MSLGINLLMKLLKEATKVLAPAGYDMEIVEKRSNNTPQNPFLFCLFWLFARNFSE